MKPASDSRPARRESAPDGYARLLEPLLFAALYAWAFLDNLRPIREYDFWWHLAGGRLFFQHWRVAFVDVFSLTCRGRGWIDTFWLLEAGMYAVWRAAGLNGIVVAAAALVAGALWFQQRLLRALDAGWAARAAAFALFFTAFSPADCGWVSQVSLVTMLFCAALWADLEACRRDGREPSLAVWLPLFALWANLHRGFVIGLAIVGLHALAGASGGLKTFARRLRLPALAAAVTLLNPYGLGVYRMIWSDFTFSPAHVHNWAATTWPAYKGYWLTGAALIPALAWRRRRGEEKDAFHLLAALMFGWLAARNLVDAPYLSLFALPLIAAALTDALALRPELDFFARRRGLWTGAALTAALAAAASARSAGGLDPASVPQGACDFIARENLRGPFFNDYRFGGYFLWRFDGAPAVFLDGRNVSVDGYAQELAALEEAKESPARWLDFLSRRGMHAALTTYPLGVPTSAMFDAYFPRDRWALVYWDDGSLLFLERVPENLPTIRREEYKTLSPDGGAAAMTARARAAGPQGRRFIAAELERAARAQPDGRRLAALARAYAETAR